MLLDIVVLAAGKGTRMNSRLPKVLQTLAGKPLLGHVIDTAEKLDGSLHIVIGHGAEQVKQQFNSPCLNWIEQQEQHGTGHAVQQALPNLENKGVSLVLYGDVPLVKQQTLKALLAKVSDTAMALLSVELEKPKGYGRIVRNQDSVVTAIVEEKDATDQQKEITEVNTGILAIKTEQLVQLLPKLSNDNAQGEYYLTDIIAMSVASGVTVDGLCIDDEIEVQGVNDKKQLAGLERAYQLGRAEELMRQGVTLTDPARFDIRGELQVGQDVSIDINCLFQGSVTLGDNVIIGPNCIIGEIGKTVTIGDSVEIKANSIIEEAVIENDCVIGPYARLRPGTQLAQKAKIGNFVETKKSKIGEGSKVNHLTYIGDTTIGKNVNIGAGTITCNYDGVNKHQTVMEDGVFIGSNTSLVAPVKVGKNATVAAGSTITKNIEEKDLAIARGKQKNLQGWVRPKKEK